MQTQTEISIAKALRDTLISPNVLDSNLEPANVVDALVEIAKGLNRLAAVFENKQ